MREIREEVGKTDVTWIAPVSVGEWRPQKDGKVWHIIATFIHCRAETDQVIL
jgi:hypothetical protein